jgi:hypothetical protein
MAALTFFFAADRLRTARPDVSLIWTTVLATMALLVIGHLFQFWILLSAEINLPPHLRLAKVSVEGFSWYSAFVSARLVLFLFLFAQIEDYDDTPYFRLVDALQSALIICLVIVVHSPTLLGAQALPLSQTVLLRALVFPLVFCFGMINWLGRAPGYARQLVGAITLYLLAKSVVNGLNIILGSAPILNDDRSASAATLVLETLPHLLFVIAALHRFPRTRQNPPASGGYRETIRFLNPVCFTIASLGLEFAIGRYNELLAGGLITLSVILYVLRSAKWQSDFRRLKEKVADTAQARANFLLDINHEIRSPLTSITLNASRLTREAGLSTDQAIMVKAIDKGAEFIISTLNDVLDMYRMESGKLRVPLKPFDVAPVISEAVEMLEPQAERRNLSSNGTPCRCLLCWATPNA